MATGEFLGIEPSKDIEVQKTDDLDLTIGLVGTKITDRLYDEDYLSDFKSLQKRAEIYERMSKGDPIVKALLRVQKTPILQARWSISFDEKTVDSNMEKQIDYLNQVIFKDMKFLGCKLFEILTMLEYGYVVFEKVFVMRNTKELGEYISIDLPIRIQKTITEFRFENVNRPDMITAFVQTPMFVGTHRKNLGNIDIPTKKLLVLTLEKIGNDPTGTSVLRPCFKPWSQKDFNERMQMIGIEKAVLGTPVLKLNDECGNSPCTQKQLNQVKEQIAAYLGNTNEVIILPGSLTLEMVLAEMNNEAIENAIKEKNSEMVLSILAQFILLGQNGNGGAYALGQDQSDFFLNSLQYIANVINTVMNDLIVTLIDLQFGEQDVYPTMKAEGINSKASSEFAKTIKDLSERGYIVNSEDLIRHIHNTYKLPLPDEFEVPPDRGLPQIAAPQEKPQEPQALSKEGFKKKTGSVQLQASYKGLERTFVAGVTRNEKFIQDFYSRKYVPVIEASESVIQNILKNGYDKTSKTVTGGTTYISPGRKNDKIKRSMKAKVKREFKRLSDELLSDEFAGDLMDGALENAGDTINNTLDVNLAFMRAGEFRSFVAGHISNMKAVFFNEERHVVENIEANFGNQLKLSVIESQVEAFRFNRNTLKLSVTAHPRATFKGEILRAAQSVDIGDFKMVIPSGVKLKPDGQTIGLVYKIQALALWESLLDDKQTGSGVVGGLGIHPNSQDYYIPISQDDLEAAQALSREQRKSENLDKITE